MRLSFLILLMIPALDVFSQAGSKDTKNLFDSLNKIDLIENLYNQISSLELEKSTWNHFNNENLINYEVMKEFCIRQDVYRNLFDKLESGIKPDNDSLSEYYEYEYGDPIYKISDSDNGFPITIYINYYTGSSSNFDANAIEKSMGVQLSEGYPVQDLTHRFLEGDTLLLSRYPRLYQLWSDNKIEMKYAFPILGYKPPAANQVPRWNFPTFYLKDNTLAAKKVLADDLIVYISSYATNLVSSLKEAGYDFDGDLIPEFLRLEREKYSKATMDVKIQIRRKFIEYLKMLYKKYE